MGLRTTGWLCGMLLCGPAWAEEAPARTKGTYLGVSVAQNTLEDWNELTLNDLGDSNFSNESWDDSDTGFRLFGGLLVSESVAVELGYNDFGEASYEGDSDGSGFFLPAGHYTVTAAVDGLDVSFAGHVALTPSIAFRARLGVLMWDTSVDVTAPDGGTGSESEDGNDLFVGGGLELGSGRVRGRLEYTRYELDEEKLTSASATLTFFLD